MNALWRLLAVVSLAVSLVLSLSPLAMTPVVAAPPETIRQATDSSDIAADSGTKTESPPTAEMPQLPDKKDQLSADIAPQDRTDDGDGSVRQRGVEAPVLFEQQTAQGADRPQEKSKTSDTSQKPERDPGDGPVKNSQEPAKKRDLTRAQSGIRIWPMPAKSYTFTQHFGCVPQLGNLYASLEGCPADAPVFHTGIDLAAPEGTPFYAAASGWVILADYDRPTADANTRITIQHDGRNEGYSTDYLHWVASYVEEGDYVHAGDPIGEVGNVGFSTGPHLHFSVTDLGTGEHVDPLRWLPDEPGLEGYVSRKPNARLRLPAGTTAGQPESADPAPPSPAVKEDVPKSPAKDGKRNKQGERIREERHTKASGDPAAGDPTAGDPTAGDPAAGDAKRANKKRSGDDAASEASVDAPADDATQAPDQTRERKRNKDGAPSEDAAAGENGGPDDSQVDTRNGDRRGNHKESGASDGASQKEPKDDRGKQAPRDPGGHETSGSHDQGGQHDRNPDRQNSDQGGHNGGGHKATANAVDSPETQPLDEPAPTVSPG